VAVEIAVEVEMTEITVTELVGETLESVPASAGDPSAATSAGESE
jgi:hypothetical protein